MNTATAGAMLGLGRRPGIVPIRTFLLFWMRGPLSCAPVSNLARRAEPGDQATGDDARNHIVIFILV